MAKRATKPKFDEAPARSAERQALAEAISAHAKARKHHESLMKADTALDRQIWDARDELDAAKTDLGETRAKATKSFAAAAVKGRNPNTGQIDKGRSKIGAIEERIEILHAAREETRAQIPAAETSAEITKLRLNDAVARVVKADPAIAGAVETYRNLQLRAYRARARLLSVSHLFGDTFRLWQAFTNEEMGAHDAGWSDTVERLRSDPDATFPEAPK